MRRQAIPVRHEHGEEGIAQPAGDRNRRQFRSIMERGQGEYNPPEYEPAGGVDQRAALHDGAFDQGALGIQFANAAGYRLVRAPVRPAPSYLKIVCVVEFLA